MFTRYLNHCNTAVSKTLRVVIPTEHEFLCKFPKNFLTKQAKRFHILTTVRTITRRVSQQRAHTVCGALIPHYYRRVGSHYYGILRKYCRYNYLVMTAIVPKADPCQRPTIERDGGQRSSKRGKQGRSARTIDGITSCVISRRSRCPGPHEKAIKKLT